MTRGNQREKDRARAAARAAKNGPKQGRPVPKVGGANSDAEALAAKIAAKKKAMADGTLQPKNKQGSNYQSKPKVQAMVNPHTGKRDPKWTAKQLGKP